MKGIAIARFAASAVLAAAVAAAWPGDAQAQAGQGFPKEFKNLLAVDKKIAPDDLKKMMNGFTDQLGVKCTFCHNLDNYASDEKKHKTDARKMIQLVQFMQANKAKYFKTDVSNDLISCGTCHRGKEEPEPFVP
jgi:photosynthetic reaction center cytochrome c subunit